MRLGRLNVVLNRGKLVSLLIPLIILLQPRSSFTWYNSVFIASFFIAFYLFVVFVNRNSFRLNNTFFGFVLMLSFSFFVGYRFQGSSLLALLCFFSIPLLTTEEKKCALSILTKILAVIIAVSLSFWLLLFFGKAGMVAYRQLDLSIIGNVGYLDDYFFFVDNPTLIFPRFYSIYEEPGALAVLLSLVIIANNFNFKKKPVLVLLFGLIFTYSLAGYMIMTVCFTISKVKSAGKFLKILVGTIVFLVLFYILFKDVEVFQYLIFNRIFGFDEYGLNHRTTSDLNNFYSSYISSVHSLSGMGVGYAGHTFAGGSGYKMFMIDYGWMGLISLLSIYISIGWNCGKQAFVLFVGILLAFLPQGGAFITWQILLYGITCNRTIENIEHETCCYCRK